MDINAFKLINDRDGHEAGDLALQQVGVVLRSSLRERDLVARVGGDEFAVLLPRTEGEHSRPVVEKLELNPLARQGQPARLRGRHGCWLSPNLPCARRLIHRPTWFSPLTRCPRSSLGALRCRHSCVRSPVHPCDDNAAKCLAGAQLMSLMRHCRHRTSHSGPNPHDPEGHRDHPSPLTMRSRRRPDGSSPSSANSSSPQVGTSGQSQL